MASRRLAAAVGAFLATSAVFAVRFAATVEFAGPPLGVQESSTAVAQPSPSSGVPDDPGFLVEPVETDYPLPPLSSRGNHCPTSDVPAGSSEAFDPESGRIEIEYDDVAYGFSRTFILDMRDPSCFRFHATRRAMFLDIVTYMEMLENLGRSGACRALKDAINEGSLKLGERPFDMRPARPFVGEVCAR
jgi:hypothetical protein